MHSLYRVYRLYSIDKSQNGLKLEWDFGQSQHMETFLFSGLDFTDYGSTDAFTIYLFEVRLVFALTIILCLVWKLYQCPLTCGFLEVQLRSHCIQKLQKLDASQKIRPRRDEMYKNLTKEEG